MSLVILGISNAMIAETTLPDRVLKMQLFPNFMRCSALNKLHSPLERSIRSGRHQDVKMIRHEDECVQPVGMRLPSGSQKAAP